MLVMLNEAVPLLLRVTACAPLLVPTSWLAKVRLVGERLTAGARAIWAIKASWRPPPKAEGKGFLDRKSVGEGKSVDLGGRLIIKKKPAATALPQGLLWL